MKPGDEIVSEFYGSVNQPCGLSFRIQKIQPA